MFDKSGFYHKFLKQFNKSRFSSKSFKNLDFSYNFRKISILVKIFERARFKISNKCLKFFLENIDYSHNVQSISIIYKFSEIKKLPFLVEIKKNTRF